MNIITGDTYTEDEFRRLLVESSSHIMRLPSGMKEDSIHKLQDKNLSAGERRSIINKLHKRRKKNKLAKQSKRKNR